MNLRTGIGKTGVAMAALVAFAMCLLSLIFKPVEKSPVQYGFCFSSPDSWNVAPFWSWLINVWILVVIVILLLLINKKYNFIRTTEPTLPAVFLIMATACPWFTREINTSMILCLANVIGLGIIFESYSSRNATHQMFTLAFIIGIGSMFQYAFIPMALAYFFWGIFMKVLRLKEILAFIAGLLCPYWIVLGIGWINMSDIHLPSLTPLFGNIHDYTDFLLLLFAVGLAAGIGVFVGLINLMKLYAGNSKVNAMNLCVTILGLVSLICIIVDFDNMWAYVITLFMCSAVQLANICALWNPKLPWVVTVVPSILFIAIFVGSILF